MSQAEYAKQHRGTRDAYESYFSGMDASMQQKVALTTGYFPTRGRIADMGSGSGRGTYDLACLYANLEVVGVDINPVSVARSQETYQASNLSYLTGDIAEKVFPDESLDGVLNSSVLHHVTSFNQFDVVRVSTTFDHQVAQLKTGGVIIVRDFVIPNGPEKVWLDLPTDDGLSEGEIKGLSSAALFERFARNWRSSLNPDTAVPYLQLTSSHPHWARFEVSLRAATEFVLRKDYRADWDAELLEEYTYLNQAEFEAAFRARGLRIINSMPIWNPWIVQNRFKNRFQLYDLAGTPIAFPPTNFLIAAEKVPATEGVELFELKQSALESPKFLSVRSYRHKTTGEHFELVTRAKQTIDLLPWFENNGQIFILAKKDFPRPLVNACSDHPNLNHSTRSGYITEPITALVDGTETPNVAIHRVLQERAGIQAEDITSIGDPFDYFTSPGGLDERVLARLVQIQPRFATPFVSPNYTKFTSAGIVRELDAGQTLRASHVGGMFDARMEINLYRLLRSLNRSVGTWIGAPIRLIEQASTDVPQETRSVLSPTAIEAFEADTTTPELKYLELREGSFSEINAAGYDLAQAEFEYVIPREISRNTVTALPVVKRKEGVFIALEQRDLPAPQHFTQNSRLAVVPAWRLPHTLQHLAETPAFLRQRFRSDYGTGLQQAWELGGAYFPTPGVTPEIVYPFACEVEAADLAGSGLQTVRLEEVIEHIDLVQDAHTLIAIHRLAHALGFLP
ncbi:MAG: methyltransferase domain-containing protein [Acidobacteria bacterium]|nr:methyltransferase domain-containing protein [Acidobacteriota bacterium]